MQRRLLQALVFLAMLAVVWVALARVGGTPGVLYAAAAILLAGVVVQRLKPAREERAPLPVRPWNGKARRIQELEVQLEHAISEIDGRGRTIEELRAQVERQQADHRALHAALQSQLAALAARLQSHESELASFEGQLNAGPPTVESAPVWSLRNRS